MRMRHLKICVVSIMVLSVMISLAASISYSNLNRKAAKQSVRVEDFDLVEEIAKIVLPEESIVFEEPFTYLPYYGESISNVVWLE